MKQVRPILIATVLLFMLITIAAGQSDDKQPTVEAYQAGWGMRIVFAPSTTITEANALRLEHNLQLQPTSYVSDDGRHFAYRYTDDRHYAAYARFYWSDTEHDGCSVAAGAEKPCPAIEPRYGYYSPVSSRVADQLRQDPHVAHVDNYNNPAYFVRWMISGVIQTVSHRWAEMTNVAFHPAA